MNAVALASPINFDRGQVAFFPCTYEYAVAVAGDPHHQRTKLLPLGCLIFLPAALHSQTASPSKSSSKLVLHLGRALPASSCMTSSASVSISPSVSTSYVESNRRSVAVAPTPTPARCKGFLPWKAQPARVRYTPARKPSTTELRKPDPLAVVAFDAAAADRKLVETSHITIIT